MSHFAISAVCLAFTFAYVCQQFGALLVNANPF